MLLRFINGRNNNRKFLSDMFGYIIDQSKTENGKYIASNGCSHTHILEDMLANKKLHNKTAGKQGEHFVISFYPDRPEVSNAEILNISAEIAETVYPEYLSVTTLYLDTKVRHTHTLLDSVNAVTGKKFSQSPSALNRVGRRSMAFFKNTVLKSSRQAQTTLLTVPTTQTLKVLISSNLTSQS